MQETVYLILNRQVENPSSAKLMSLEKQELEERISQERTIGSYVFDEQKNCFFGNAETALYITKIAENRFKLVAYFFDGYEVYVDEGEEEIYEGDEKTAKQQAINNFNKGTFMGYPIIFTHITCHVHEEKT